MSRTLPCPPVHHLLDGRTRAAARRQLADLIKNLIDVLDSLDGDPDDEPSLGWTKTMAWGSTDDREEAVR